MDGRMDGRTDGWMDGRMDEGRLWDAYSDLGALVVTYWSVILLRHKLRGEGTSWLIAFEVNPSDAVFLWY